MELTRKVLYNLLWTHPTVRVAAALGISSNSLAKTCERRGIPTPPRGYWQRLGTDRESPIPPLPPVDFELPLPWAATAKLELLVGSSTATESARASPSNDAPEPPAQEATASADPTAGTSPPPLPPRTPSRTRNSRDSLAISAASPNEAPAMAALASEMLSCERFCDEVLRVARTQPLAVSEVMESWVRIVRRSYRERDPLATLVEHCTRIAQGQLPVPWE